MLVSFRIFRFCPLIAIFCLPPLWPSSVIAGHLPLWEIGLGGGIIRAPHYRGSKSIKDYFIPVPYLIYRGDLLKIDEDGIRSEIIDNSNHKLDVSLSGHLPVPRADNGARKDMPKLAPIGELGASYEIKLWKHPLKNHRIWLEFPLRTVFSAQDLVLKYQGWILSPFINYRIKHRTNGSLWRFSISTGPIFADNRYHDYFYSVDPQYSTAEREEYDAKAGYSGSRITITLANNSKKQFFGAFIRYDNLSHTHFEDSPLIETKHYLIAGIAFSWIFTASNQFLIH